MSESNESARFNTPDMENGRVAPNGHGAKPVNTPVSGGALAGYPSLVDEEGLSLVELLGMLRQEWRLIAAVFLLVVLAVAAYTFTREPVYQASSVVLVDTNGRRSSGGTSLEDLLSVGGANRTLYNEVEILRQSIPLAERVGARLLEEDPAGSPLVGGVEDGSPTVDMTARRILGGQVRFAPISDRADLLTITAMSTAPTEAALIANLYAEEYRNRSRETSRASVVSSRSFIEEQAEKRSEELGGIEDRLAEFMTREGAVALDSEGQNAVSQISSIDAAIEEARVEIEVERTALRSLEEQVEEVEPGLARRIASGVENEIRVLQERIAQLELQASDYYAVDPSLRGNESANEELQAIATSIAGLRRQVDALSRQYVQEVLAVGGMGPEEGGSALSYITQLKRQVVEKRIRIQGLQARLTVLQNQLSSYEARLRDIPRQTIELAQLTRQRQSTERTYLFLIEKLQEARVAEESELGYVEVIRRADVPGSPGQPAAGAQHDGRDAARPRARRCARAHAAHARPPHPHAGGPPAARLQRARRGARHGRHHQEELRRQGGRPHRLARGADDARGGAPPALAGDGSGAPPPDQHPVQPPR